MKRIAGLFCMIAGIAACAISPGPSHQPVQYLDFGPASDPAGACAINARLGAIKSSQAVRGTEIWYRYRDRPFAPAPYAFSRWSAPPAELLRRQLQPGFRGGAESGRVDLELFRLELHVATELAAGAAADARLQMEISAARYAANGTLLERRLFVLEPEAQASPDGAAEAASQALAKWQSELCRWMPAPEISP